MSWCRPSHPGRTAHPRGDPMMVRRTAVVAGALVTALMLAACGGGDDDDAATGEGPPTDTAGAGRSEADGGGDFCTDLQAVVAGNVGIMTTVLHEAPVTIETVIDEAGSLYPGMAEAAVTSAPPELEADVVTVTAATTDMIEALAAADLGAPGAASAALDSVAFGDEVDAAADRLSEYARTECGFDPDAMDAEIGGAAMPTAAEPPDACGFVDPQVVADAAGLPVDVADDGGGGPELRRQRRGQRGPRGHRRGPGHSSRVHRADRGPRRPVDPRPRGPGR